MMVGGAVEGGWPRMIRAFFFFAILSSSPDGDCLSLVRPRSGDVREFDATGRLRLLRAGLPLLRLGLPRRLALRSCGRGRVLFFGLFLFVPSNPLILLLPDGVRGAGTGVAKVELQ